MTYTTTTGNTIDLMQNYDSVFGNNTANDINININIKLTTTEYQNINYQSSPCDGCSNNPKNGGNGICCCTLGLPSITC